MELTWKTFHLTIQSLMTEVMKTPLPIYRNNGESGVTRVRSEADVNRLIEEDFYLISLGQLLLLAKAELKSTCSNSDCKGMLTISTNTVGSALYLSWVCPSGHVEYKWCSQPLLKRRLHSGDLLTSASILMSGNNYSKIALLAKMLRLKIVSSSTFFKIQRHYLVPCVDEYWLSHQQEILTKYQDKEIVILGDGRMDSPGYCAQYCTYTIMENESKDILEIVTIDKRQTDKKSTIMERAAFQEGLNQLRDKGLQIKEAVTDAHTQIAYLMKTTYPGITHSFDIWHAAKNLGKKITKAGQQKNCKALQKWSRHIRNHFWYCCQKASTYEEFLGLWCGVIHHVTNEHEWVLSYGQGTNSCNHGPLTESADSDKEWLEKVSPAHVALVKIVMDKRFTNQIPYFVNCRSTAELETFQQSIHVNAAKRFSYVPPVYRARNRLAAVDHNVHHSREIMRNKKGEIVYHRHYNKKSGRWSAYPVKVNKTYPQVAPLKSLLLAFILSK
ncbi:uncharacterized protein [Ptychodera flava]|uniref:uncharacterized protein isoform X1 n=1 Tax=Ptychodera flava TaxID=63121 RepID=UPI00396A7C04